MFDGIVLTHTVAEKPLVSCAIAPQEVIKPVYDRENLMNSEFHITGSADSFVRPPLSERAQSRLSYLQAFTIFSYGAGSFTRRKNYRSFLLLYTYKGTGRLEYEGKAYTLSPERGALIDCRKPHYYAAETDWKVAVLHIQGSMVEEIAAEYEAEGQAGFQEPVTGRFHRYLEQLLTIYDSPDLHRELKASHCIQSMLMYLLLLREQASSDGHTPHCVCQAMKYMEASFARPVSLDSLAELTRTSKYHLSKEFKRYTGFSPYDYLICLRIDQAKLLLKNTTLPAIKIAHEVGIHDVNNFNYLFKKKVGMTPIQYRDSADCVL